jgi:hypothetical protein
VTGATGPWVPGSGVGRRPHGGRGPDALPTAYLLLCVCITSSALVVRTLGLVHLRTGSSDLGYLSRRSGAVRFWAQYASSALNLRRIVKRGEASFF